MHEGSGSRLLTLGASIGAPHCCKVGKRAQRGTRWLLGPFPHTPLPKASCVPENHGDLEAGHQRQPAILCWETSDEVTQQPVRGNGGIT